MQRTLVVVLSGVAAVSCASFDSDSSATQELQSAPVDIQFLTISDWHAQVDPISVGGRSVGGAAALSAYFQADRAANPNTLTLTAGDAFGASPPLSGLFDDTPAIRAMNMMGIQADTFGNHNFDKGLAYLQARIDEAQFRYVDANLNNLDDNLTEVMPFKIFNVGGIKVAVIGATNPDAPELVKPGSLGAITVEDPAVALNAARARAVSRGAQVTVAIVHMGIVGFDSSAQPVGPLVDLANQLSGFDFIFGDHTDVPYSGVINNALVVENRSKGATYARISAKVDPATGVIGRSAQFVTPFTSGVTPDPAIAAMLDDYRAQLSAFLGTVIGTSTVAVPRADSCGNGQGRTCESLIGDVISDAMRFESTADFAITNSGGIRANLTCPTTDLATDFCPQFTAPPYPITLGQVQTVLPFGNVVVEVNVTGSELKAILENGVSRMPFADGRFPQLSGLCATYDISAPPGSRILGAVRQAADGSCTGTAVDLTAAATYLVYENDFMASGGDGYPNLSARMSTLEIMSNVVSEYLTHEAQISPAVQGRLQCVSSGATLCPVTLY